MMKNMEWGAVAYLSSSIYGRYTNSTTCIKSGCEIWINNVNTGYGTGTAVDGMLQYGPTITGCSGTTVSATLANSMSACATNYDWKTGGVNASTTGNQYGIYDMSGGSFEHVMGNMVDASGNFYSAQSGFSAAPDAKYYNSYAYDASSNITHERGLLGDATKETLKTFGLTTGGWNSDSAFFPNGVYSWLFRGSVYLDGDRAGVFYFYYGTGGGYNCYGFRSVVSAS